jgi:hypothetical protein
MAEAGLTAKTAAGHMDLYKKSLVELLGLTSKQGAAFSDLSGALVSLGKAGIAALTIESLVKAFMTLDKVAANVNKSIAGVSLQAGDNVRGSGFGGVFGKVEMGSVKDLEGAIIQVEADLTKLGLTTAQSAELLSKFAYSLPRGAIESLAPAFTKAAASASASMGIDLGTATDLLTLSFRSGVTSAKGLSGVFDRVSSTSKNTGLSMEESAKGFLNLWSGTRLFGATQKTAQDSLEAFGVALKNQTITVQELTRLQQNLVQTPIDKYAAFIALADQTKTHVPGETPEISGLSILERATALFEHVNLGPDSAKNTKEFLSTIQDMVSKPGQFVAAGPGKYAQDSSSLLQLQNLLQLMPGGLDALGLAKFTGKDFLGNKIGTTGSGESGTTKSELDAAFEARFGKGAELTKATLSASEQLTLGMDKAGLAAVAASHGLFALSKDLQLSAVADLKEGGKGVGYHAYELGKMAFDNVMIPGIKAAHPENFIPILAGIAEIVSAIKESRSGTVQVVDERGRIIDAVAGARP